MLRYWLISKRRREVFEVNRLNEVLHVNFNDAILYEQIFCLINFCDFRFWFLSLWIFLIESFEWECLL